MAKTFKVMTTHAWAELDVFSGIACPNVRLNSLTWFQELVRYAIGIGHPISVRLQYILLVGLVFTADRWRSSNQALYFQESGASYQHCEVM
jgi:hypothetical protein